MNVWEVRHFRVVRVLAAATAFRLLPTDSTAGTDGR
jgi:hypothetical protein